MRAARAACVTLAFGAFGACAPAEPPRAPEAPPAGERARSPAYPKEEGRWPKFHSVRFHASVPLPDGKAWRIDDHSRSELVATHEPTRSRLVLAEWNASALVNRAMCEDEARGKGLVPEGPLQTVEDARAETPSFVGWDTRVWVAVAPPKDPNGPLEGYVFLFGANVRKCLFVGVSTAVASAKDEPTLSDRLALVKVRVVGGLTLDPAETGEDAAVPMQKRGER